MVYHFLLITLLQVAQFGVNADLVRMSVGLEDVKDLIAMVQRALATAECMI